MAKKIKLSHMPISITPNSLRNWLATYIPAIVTAVNDISNSTITLPLDLGMRKDQIVGVPDPLNPFDVSNRNFVLSEIESIRQIDIIGDVYVSGSLGSGPFSATLVRPIQMKDERIVDLADPIDLQDAVNKQTLDLHITNVTLELKAFALDQDVVNLNLAKAYATDQDIINLDLSKTFTTEQIDIAKAEVEEFAKAEDIINLDLSKTFTTEQINIAKEEVEEFAKAEDIINLDLSKTFTTEQINIAKEEVKEFALDQDALTIEIAKLFTIEQVNLAKEFTTEQIDLAKEFTTEQIDLAKTEVEEFAKAEDIITLSLANLYTNDKVLNFSGVISGSGKISEEIVLSFPDVLELNRIQVQEFSSFLGGLGVNGDVYFDGDLVKIVSGNLDVNFGYINNVKYPQADHQAANVQFVTNKCLETGQLAQDFTNTKALETLSLAKTYTNEQAVTILADAERYTNTKVSEELTPLTNFTFYGNISASGSLLSGSMEVDLSSSLTFKKDTIISWETSDFGTVDFSTRIINMADSSNFKGFRTYFNRENNTTWGYFDVHPSTGIKFGRELFTSSGSLVQDKKMLDISFSENKVKFFFDTDFGGCKGVNAKDPDPSEKQALVTVNYLENHGGGGGSGRVKLKGAIAGEGDVGTEIVTTFENLDFGGNKLENIAPPEASSDAVDLGTLDSRTQIVGQPFTFGYIDTDFPVEVAELDIRPITLGDSRTGGTEDWIRMNQEKNALMLLSPSGKKTTYKIQFTPSFYYMLMYWSLFSNPLGITYLDGKTVVLDQIKKRVSFFNENGNFVDYFEREIEPLAITSSSDEIFVSSYGKISVFDKQKNNLRNFYGSDSIPDYQGNLKYSISCGDSQRKNNKGTICVTEDGMLYIADSNRKVVYLYDERGKFRSTFTFGDIYDITYVFVDDQGNYYLTYRDLSSGVSKPFLKVFDKARNLKFSVDLSMHSEQYSAKATINSEKDIFIPFSDTVVVLSEDGNFKFKFQTGGTTGSRLAIDQEDNCYCCVQENNENLIKIFTKNGVFLKSFPIQGNWFSPICIDRFKNIFCVEFSEKKIYVYDANGVLRFSFSPFSSQISLSDCGIDREQNLVVYGCETKFSPIEYIEYAKKYQLNMGVELVSADVLKNNGECLYFNIDRHNIIQKMRMPNIIEKTIFGKAGIDKFSFDGGPSHDFSSPYGIAIDNQGKRYISERGPDAVSVFDKDWNYQFSFDGTSGGGQKFHEPSFVCTDPLGNIYVSDKGNKRIVKCDNYGNFLWENDGTRGGGSRFRSPQGLAVSESMELLHVCDSLIQEIKVFDLLSGDFLYAVRPEDGGGTKFERPTGICFYSNNRILVTDVILKKVFCFNQYFGPYREWSGGQEDFDQNGGISADIDGNIAVVDREKNNVQIFDDQGNFKQIIKSEGKRTGPIFGYSVAFDKERTLYIPEATYGDIQIFRLDTNEDFTNIEDFAVANDGTIYVSDSENKNIQVFDNQGDFKFKFAKSRGVTTNWTLNNTKIACNTNKDIYVVRDNSLILVLDEFGIYKTTISGTRGGGTRFSKISSIFFEDSGKLIVADEIQKNVQVFDSDGNFLYVLVREVESDVIASITIKHREPGVNDWTSFGLDGFFKQPRGVEKFSVSPATGYIDIEENSAKQIGFFVKDFASEYPARDVFVQKGSNYSVDAVKFDKV